MESCILLHGSIPWKYKFESQNLLHKCYHFQNIHHFSLQSVTFWWTAYVHQNVTLAGKMMNFCWLLKNFIVVPDILCINSIIDLEPISRSPQAYFCFYKKNIVFEANVMFDGQKWEFVSIKKCNISKSACLISWKRLGVNGSIFYHIFHQQICLV